jgi:sterol desaturase/sphingolipid hydroxylase (fatty acid hydroxylase superfamily)
MMAAMDIEFLLSIKLMVVGGVLALFAIYERIYPAAGGPLLLRFGRATKAAWLRLFKNVSLLGINALISPIIVVPITVFAADHSFGFRPDWWSGWLGLGLDILLLDLWIYWWHRANHELQFLWRFHSVHHLDETLDTSSALRFHFGEVILSALVRGVVIVVFDLPLASVLLFEAIVLASAIFHHSDAKLPERLETALSKVIITPSIHWIHHHAIRADTDSNYGTLFSFWDPLFRSRSATKRTPDMPIGVEGLKDRSLPGLITTPLRSPGPPAATQRTKTPAS